MKLFSLMTVSFLCVLIAVGQGSEVEQANILQRMEASVHPDDLSLIEANITNLSLEQLTAMQHFMTDSRVIADISHFDVSNYSSWDEYNYSRPLGDTIVSILARRDLFLDPARQLNNRTLTNMSAEALAALAFSQTYVEEKWDHEVPWDGDPNNLFNWVHPDLVNNPSIRSFLRGDFLYRARVEYWWATYWSFPKSLARLVGLSRGTDISAALQDMRPPNSNLPRLAGYSYPIGNQLFLQTAETTYWYADYLNYGETRYGAFVSTELDTQIRFPEGSAELFQTSTTNSYATLLAPEFSTYPGLWELFDSPFGADLRMELTHPETAAFWNVMRFLHASARQREGGGSSEHPENGQPPLIALRYEERTATSVGREQSDISAFALLTTVYSDSILLDFTNWDSSNKTLLVNPVDQTLSNGIHRLVSERNKAILVVEQMGNENFYPNATHVAGSRGLGFNLSTQYDLPLDGDFLPYTTEEANALVMALVVEAMDYGVEASRVTLCNSPLLRLGYEEYIDQAIPDGNNPPDWATLVAELCN